MVITLSTSIIELIVLLVAVKSVSSTFERQRDRSYDSFHGKKLTFPQDTKSIEQKSSLVADKMDCVFLCTETFWCQSINFKTSSESSGLHVCELISATRFDINSTITQDNNYEHYTIKSPCDNKPCGCSTCIPLGDEDYDCVNATKGPQPPMASFSPSGSWHLGSVQSHVITYSGEYLIRAGGARGGTHTYDYGTNPGTYYGGKGATMEGRFQLKACTTIKVVVGQRGGNSVEVKGGQATTQTATQLGLSVEDNAGTGGGGGSFVYTTENQLLLVAGGGGGASSGYNGVDGQTGTAGSSSIGSSSSRSRGGGTGGNPGICNSAGASHHGGVGAGWNGQGCKRAGVQHGGPGGSRSQGWVGGEAGQMNSGSNGGPAPGAVGGYGGGGGGSEDNGASGGGGGYSGGGSGTHSQQAGGGGGSYCSGTGCSGTTGGNSNDNGFVQISFC